MKKRVLSLLLALVLVFGVAVVPSIGAEAASKKVVYTKFTLKTKKTTPLTFTVTAKNKVTAAKQLSNILGVITKNKAKFKVKIDGKKATIQNKKGTIYVGKKTLENYVETQTSTTKTKVKITYNAEFKKVLKGVSLAGKSGKYKYSIKVGAVTFKNIKVKKGKITFVESNKTRTAVIKKGVIYIKGNVTKAKFVKKLKTNGVLKSAKKVKM